MTREEEIDQAKKAFQEDLYYNPRICFEEGIEWADNHPKSPWISVNDDLPCNHEELWVMTGRLIHTKKVLVVLTDNTVRLLSMLYDEVNDKWKWEFKNNIIFWMPIPKLPK